MSYTIKVLSESELIQANVLYRIVYGKERSDSYFNWEFLNGPAGKAIYVGAFDGDKLIGTQAAIPLYFVGPEGKLMLTAKSEDTLLDPDYRGKGLFELMYKLLIVECRKAQIVSIWGFTYAKKPFLKIGFQIPFDSSNGVYVINMLSGFNYLSSLNPNNKFKQRFQIFGLCLWSYLKALIHPIKLVDDVKRKNISYNKFLERELFQETQLSFLNETDNYLNWRIHTNPYSNNYFELVIYNSDGEVSASLIYNIFQSRVAYIEQMLFVPSLSKLAPMYSPQGTAMP